MMDSGKRWPIMQYGWSGWLVNMPIPTMGDSHDGTQIEVNSRKLLEKS